MIPVSCGIFLYYLLMYVKQNASALTSEATEDLVQRYVQIIQSILFNQNMMIMIATFAVGIIVVYLIRRLSMDYAWIVLWWPDPWRSFWWRLWAILCSACPWRRESS